MDNLLVPSLIHLLTHTHVVAMGATHVYRYRSVSSVHGSRINLCMPIKCDTRIPNYNSKVHLDRQNRCIADVYERRNKINRLLRRICHEICTSESIRLLRSLNSSTSGYRPAHVFMSIFSKFENLNDYSVRPQIHELTHLMSDVLFRFFSPKIRNFKCTSYNIYTYEVWWHNVIIYVSSKH